MLNFAYVNGTLTTVSPDYARGVINRNDFTTLAQAAQVADDATTLTGTRHIAVDQGAHTAPRYDVIVAPVIGRLVSRYFNGDSYPAGTIVKVSQSLRRVETSDGTVFFRVRQSASWRADGTWFMAPGHTTARNPSF